MAQGSSPHVLFLQDLRAPVPLREQERARHLVRLLQSLGPVECVSWTQGPASTVQQALRDGFRPGRVLWAFGIGAAAFVPEANALGWHTVLDLVAAESRSLFDDLLASLSRWPQALRAARLAYSEERLCGCASIVVTSSEIDATRLGRRVPEVPIHVVPAWLELQDTGRSAEAEALWVFRSETGSHEDLAAARWLGEELLPRLRSALGQGLPQVEVHGFGAEHAQQLESLGLRAGSPAPQAWHAALERAQGALFPSQSSRDARLSILQALERGVPVIATGRSAQGLSLSPNEEIFLADRPDGFVGAWLRLLQDARLRESVSDRARQTLRRRYDWRASVDTVAAILADLVDKPKRRD